ncbi:hypothetical protein GBSOP10_11042 [Armatimonadetes bacterium GBS]|nr:MAG: hypothetical protein KatS3mg021_1820 [Fimbriimonadales bacterium]CUU11176.1 hypothetical protein GBSOP10_11042 [Armatimonadetes bacterium GBS]CUU36272.1 hypothetical protein GXSOP10_122225 [Armatimonadetes bacterium GXS]
MWDAARMLQNERVNTEMDDTQKISMISQWSTTPMITQPNEVSSNACTTNIIRVTIAIVPSLHETQDETIT